MISSVTKYLLFALIFLRISFAQQYLDAQFKSACSLYDNGDFFNAITEFKRLLFFDEQNKYSFIGNMYLGKSYKGGAFLDDAIKYFSLAKKNATDPEEFYQSQTEIIRCNILRRTIPKAFQLIKELEDDSRFTDKKNDLIYWRAWAYIFADDWESAAQEFETIDKNHELKSFCNDVAGQKFSGTLLFLASAIIPGFGQIYTGNEFSGILSLAWCGLFGYLSINSFYADRIFDGFVYTGLFLRFHRGNIQNVNKFVKQENIAISNRALDYLQYKYAGLKP